MKVLKVTVSESGALSVPAEVLREAGAGPGDEVEVQVGRQAEGDRPTREIIADIQKRFKQALGGQSASVDEFLAERRTEWGET